MADPWEERQRAGEADDEQAEWMNAEGRFSPDDPEFRDYRPSLGPGERYRGPRQGGDPRFQSPDDPEFAERLYRPNLGRGPRQRGRLEAPADAGRGQPPGRPRSSDEDDEWRRPGRFTGYGPRGYQRSDDRIREDIGERLTYYGELDARDIEIEVKDGEVTLTGTVEERRDKRAAERIAETVSGVHDVHNQLQIRRHAYRYGQ